MTDSPDPSQPRTRPRDAPLRRWAEDRLASLGAAEPRSWTALRVEASHRRFYRLRCGAATQTGARTYVVMESPPQLENNAQFLRLARLFARHGIEVPRVHAADEARGYFLLSDLGERHFADVYREAGPQRVLPGALATLNRLQGIDDPAIEPYTRQRFTDELDLYRRWFLEALLQNADNAMLDGIFELLLDSTEHQPRCCVHRDFHSRNLLLTASDQIGVVDFQDALAGPATYDLASLLRDCYYRFPENEVARWRDAYLASTPLALNRAAFARDLDFIALQRQLKAVGIFSRLLLRDGKDSHLEHIVPVLQRIHDLAALYPELGALAAHVAAVLPAARRRLAVDGSRERGG